VKQRPLEIVPTSALIDQFAEVCVAQNRELLHARLHKKPELIWQMMAIDRELRKRGGDARLALLKLYHHPNMQVRLQAATLTLAVAPVEAREVIDAIARSGRMPQAAEARGTLRELDTGVFKPD
jgi:hypothetical protein